MSSLLIRRLGIGSVAAASYGTMVYLTYQFMTVNVEKNKEAIEANFGSSSTTTTTTTTTTNATGITAITASREGCNCNTFNSITDPKRTSTFNRIAQVYDEQISRDEQVMLLPLLRRALIYFNAKGKVLEVGAGTGRNLEYYSFKNVEKVVLTDVSEEMLLQAREKVKAMDGSSSFFSSSSKKGSSSSSISSSGSGSKFQLFVADAANMKSFYPDDTFDTIVDTFGLCSFDDPVAVLKELQRVCKKDGKILLLEHGRSKSWTGLSNYLDKNAERHATNWGCVWNRDLDDILEEAGLVVDTLQTWHFGTTYYVVCRPSERVKREMEMEMLQSDITTSSATSTTTKSDGGTSVSSDGSDSTASKARFWNKWLHS